MRYQLVRGEDGIVWVSIQPAMKDIVDVITTLKELPTDNLEEHEQNQLNLNLLGLEATYSFLGALVTEVNLREEKAKGTPDENLH